MPRRPSASAEARRAVSAGPITANPDHLSRRVHAKRADCCPLPAGFRVSSIAEIIHPPKPGAADRDARRGLRTDRAATSGNGEPLRLPPCDALRPRIRAGHDAPPPGTHCPPLRRPRCRALRQWLRAGHDPPLRGTHYPPLRPRHGVSLCGRIRVPQPCATACAPRAVPGEWRPAGPREALRACTGSRLRVASPLATSWPARWATGGGPPCVHPGDTPCTPPFSSPGQPWGSHGDVSSCAAPG